MVPLPPLLGLKLVLGGKSTRELEAKVTRPISSVPLANLLTNPAAAAFKGAQEPLLASDPERSITIITFTSRREAWAVAPTIVVPLLNHPMNPGGMVAVAVMVTVRTASSVCSTSMLVTVGVETP